MLVLVAAPFCACAAAEDEVVVSGRIQIDPESGEPLANAFVRITDSNKTRRCFVTACDGTFSVRKSDGVRLALPIMDIAVERVDAPFEPAGLARTLVASRMRGRVGDQRSCNGCHAGGVSMFVSAELVPSELRGVASTCVASSAEMRCPEDRIVDDELDLIRDRATYRDRVDAAFIRRCGSADCHGSGPLPLSMLEFDGVLLMDKARGGANHGGGRVVVDGDFTDQCFADWLGVPRAPSPIKVTHADACRRAAAE